MLKLKELRLQNVGRFVTPQVIRFDSLGGLVQVDAENKNTGGSSGSGKSTIFNALEYLLGLNDIPTTVLQSRLTKEGIAVSATMDWDGQEITVTRSKSSGLIINIGPQIISGTSKIVEEKLDEILAMPRKLFRPMLHKRQKEGGFFLDFTPKETHEFLTDCLGLSGLRKKIEALDKITKDLEAAKLTTETLFSSAKAGFTATNDAVLALGIVPAPDMHPEVVERLKAKLFASLEVIAQIEQRHRSELSDLNGRQPVAVFPNYDTTLLNNLRTKHAEITKEISAVHAAEKERQYRASSMAQTLRAQKTQLEYQVSLGKSSAQGVQKLAEEIKRIRAAICPTCEQTWVTEKAKEKEKELMANLLAMKTAMEEGEKAIAKVADLEKQILEQQALSVPLVPANLQERQETCAKIQKIIEAEVQKERDFNVVSRQEFNTALDAHKNERQSLSFHHSKELEQVRGQAEVDRMAFSAAEIKLNMYRAAKDRYESQLSSLSTQLKSYEVSVEANGEKLKTIESRLAIAEEAKRAVKSYTSCSFDEALDSISETATRIIRAIPNMANATIQLEGIKETKDGKIKEEVNAVISMDGELGISIKSLSGGERSAVDLAVDLAVIDLIESKTGKGIDIFILDEPFTGLDTACIEMALEVLKNSNLNKRLVIVDHNPEAKEMVHDRIIVQREGQTSNILA